MGAEFFMICVNQSFIFVSLGYFIYCFFWTKLILLSVFGCSSILMHHFLKHDRTAPQLKQI